MVHIFAGKIKRSKLKKGSSEKNPGKIKEHSRFKLWDINLMILDENCEKRKNCKPKK